MRQKKQNTGARFSVTMTLGFTAVFIAIIVIVCTLVMNKTDEVLKNKVSSMTAALNVQMKLNMDSYLERLEKDGTLVFSDKEVYTYVASDETAESYEAIDTENKISDELYELCIMENFVDFGIVYTNNHTVGKISNGTKDLFADKLYDDLSAMINRARTADGWAAGYNNDFKRIYYVKRINDGAVLVISFYTTELAKVFEHPGGIEDITVRLTDSNNSIIYSSAKDDEKGAALPDAISSRIKDNHSAAILDDQYLVTVNSCGDEWRVICSVPTEIILKEKNEVRFYVTLVAVIACVLAFIISALLSRKISNPVNAIVSSLSKKASTDQLTSLLNKKSFEDIVADKLDAAPSAQNFCALLMDIDDFKRLNDNLGHAAGDKVLTKVGEILRSLFGDPAILGRLGGDEFCVFLRIPANVDGREFMSTSCDKICRAFRNDYADDDEKYKVSVSIGAASTADSSRFFQSLYTNADTALYKAKKMGKDTYSVFDPKNV